MSYQSHFESEYKQLPAHYFKPEELESIRKCIAYSAKDGGSAGNLFVLRNCMSAFVGSSPDTFMVEDLQRLTLAEWVDRAPFIALDRPIYTELSKYTLPAVARIVQILILAVTFRPFTSLQGTPDEWFDHGEGRSAQNKRFGSIFKDEKGAYWLDRFEVRYPSEWSDQQRWTGYSRRGYIDFPFNNEANPEPIHYTDETQRMRIATDSEAPRQFIIQTALFSAAGQAIVPVVYRETEEITPTLAQEIIAIMLKLWAATVDRFPDPVYPYERHMELLSDIGWASEYDSDKSEPDTVKVYDVEIPYGLINHIRRAVALLPVGVVVKDNAFYSDSPNLRDGHFEAIPVHHINEDYSDWVVTEKVSLRWVDVLYKETGVYHVMHDAARVSIVAGDQSDWLWRSRTALGIPHPERDTTHDPVSDANCDTPAPGIDDNLTDPADTQEDGNN